MTSYNLKNYLTLKEAATATGLSVYYLRNGCKAGNIAHIMSGKKYLVNVQMLIEDLNSESEAGKKNRKPVEV